MTMAWFIPVAGLIGLAGTRTAYKARQRKQDRGWWLLLCLAWLPSFCWLMAQWVAQY